MSERTFVHDAAGVSFTVPAGWTEIPAHQAARKIDPEDMNHPRRRKYLLTIPGDTAQLRGLGSEPTSPG